MYIWRGKNRRDRINQQLLGDAAYTAAHDDRSHEDEDERLRYEREKLHRDYYMRRIRSLMEEYLDTKAGQEEIELLRKHIELERRAKHRVLDSADTMSLDQDNMKKSVRELFRKFAMKLPEEYFETEIDDSNLLMDEAGLKNLLSHLGMNMTEKQYRKYANNKLKFDSIKKTVSFPEFFEGKVIYSS
jgi:hypothetical protein